MVNDSRQSNTDVNDDIVNQPKLIWKFRKDNKGRRVFVSQWVLSVPSRVINRVVCDQVELVGEHRLPNCLGKPTWKYIGGVVLFWNRIHLLLPKVNFVIRIPIWILKKFSCIEITHLSRYNSFTQYRYTWLDSN